jgi:hypothetical protein
LIDHRVDGLFQLQDRAPDIDRDTVRSAAAFKIVVTDVVWPALAADASNGMGPRARPTAARRYGEIMTAEGVIQTPRRRQKINLSGIRDRVGPESMFLDGLQVPHDGADILTAKSEFRHIWMARDDALAESFF